MDTPNIPEPVLIVCAVAFAGFILFMVIWLMVNDRRTHRENLERYTEIARSILHDASQESLRLPPTMRTEFVRSIHGHTTNWKVWARIRIDNDTYSITIEYTWECGVTERDIVDLIADCFRAEGYTPAFKVRGEQPKDAEFCTPSNRFA